MSTRNRAEDGSASAHGSRPAPERAPRRPAGTRLIDLEDVELEIEKLVAGGDGLARWRGVPIFVPRSAPGDLVRARIVARHADYGRAEITELLRPGPGRRTPPCPHFADCGGCDLQHLDEATQLRVKSAATVETLERLSGLRLPVPRSILAGAPWAYRTRAQVHLDRKEGIVRVGYHARSSRRLVPIRRCPVLAPALERAVVELAEAGPEPAPARVDLALGDDGRVAAAPPVGVLAGGELIRRVGDFDYRFDARCFFQGHAGLLASLVAEVVGGWRGEEAFDLFGGVGLFALPLTSLYRRVTLVEGERVAARYAAKNARLAHRDDLSVVARAVESWLPRGLPDGADRVVVDPPRSGLSLVVRRLLAGRRPGRVTYVSCHAATLARDLRELTREFEVESLVLADLFPQTGHMEIVVQLVRKERS